MKRTNIRIIGVPEGEEREKETETIFQEIIAENFPNLGEEPLPQIQEAQRVPYKINPRRNILRHILIKLTQMKESLRELWDNVKCINNHIIGVPEGEEREKGTEKKYLKR